MPTQDDGTVLFKCKPESVEEVHWVAGINKAAVTESSDIRNRAPACNRMAGTLRFAP